MSTRQPATTTETRCLECDAPIHRPPPASRDAHRFVAPCTASRARARSTGSHAATRRSAGRPELRSPDKVACAECGKPIHWNRTRGGRPPERCPPCRAERRTSLKRLYKRGEKAPGPGYVARIDRPVPADEASGETGTVRTGRCGRLRRDRVGHRTKRTSQAVPGAPGRTQREARKGTKGEGVRKEAEAEAAPEGGQAPADTAEGEGAVHSDCQRQTGAGDALRVEGPATRGKARGRTGDDACRDPAEDPTARSAGGDAQAQRDADRRQSERATRHPEADRESAAEAETMAMPGAAESTPSSERA